MMPPAKLDYPRTWGQFLDQFASEEACGAYLEHLRWPSGFACLSCGSMTPPYRASRLRLICKDCRHQNTVTAATIFDKTRTPLRVWFAAAWYLTNQKQGVSALGLKRVLGLGSYQTAWMMLHRFRCAMVRAGRERLRGVVEVDEAYVAITDRENPVPALRRKSHTDKILVGIAVEILHPKGFGRIRLRQLPRDSKQLLRKFIEDNIEPGSVVRTDGSGSYAKLEEIGYAHERTVMYGSDIPAHVSMAGVHRVASLLKRWLLGTHHGSVQPVHLDAYLDEFVFRFNRRSAASRGMLFYRLLEQAVVTDPVTYQDIVHPPLEPGEAA